MYQLPNKVELVFRHLYGDVYAAFIEAKYSWEMPKIIFPNGFLPEVGEKYVCTVHETRTGEFVFENVKYRTCHAMWEDGSPIDFIRFEFDDERKKEKTAPTLGTLMQGLNLANLPTQHEVLTLRVQSDRKHGGYMFVPEYQSADKDADGQPSMRIFKPVGKRVELRPGTAYRARVENVRNTGRLNARQCVILEVGVTLL